VSLYSALSLEVPTVAYSVFHQALAGVKKDDYTKTMKELHNAIRTETGAIAARYAEYLHETISREAENLQTSLAEFLHTPIGSDAGEVHRILTEGLERLERQLGQGGPPGLLSSTEGRVFIPTGKTGAERRLLQEGRKYLRGLGFEISKGSGDVFESVFFVRGGLNLDILEHIVRDRLGIYAPTHGKHIKEFGGYAYTAYNVVSALGARPVNTTSGSFVEALFIFSKPDVKYAPFRNGLVRALDRMKVDLALEHLMVLQRKLGLGVGREFVLKIVCSDPARVTEAVRWLELYDGQPFVKQSLISDGKLVMTSVLF
jgi:hypothetical protein